MGNFVERLLNMLTAISYAEAGDLDTVKELLQRRYAHEAEPEGEDVGSHSAIPAL